MERRPARIPGSSLRGLRRSRLELRNRRIEPLSIRCDLSAGSPAGGPVGRRRPPSLPPPPARGRGGPRTGRSNPPSGATFQGLLTGAEDDRFLLASDAGYGFVVQFGQLQAKNKAGKAVLTLPKNARVLSPAAIAAGGQDPLVVVATNEGRMLVFPLADLPELARGKGNKLIGIPSARAAAREEFVAGLCVVAEGDTLQVTSGGHYRNFKWSELEHFRGERGRRGSKLPKGYQRVTRLQVVTD